MRITPPLPGKTASLGFARVSFRRKLRLLSRCKLLALGLRWVSFRRKLRSLRFPLARKTAYRFVAPSHSTKPADAGLLWGVFSAYRTSSPLQNRLRWVLQGFLRGNCSPPQRTSMSKRVDISHVCGLRSVFIQVHPPGRKRIEIHSRIRRENGRALSWQEIFLVNVLLPEMPGQGGKSRRPRRCPG